MEIKKSNRLFFPIIHRWIFLNQKRSISTKISSIRSYFVTFIEKRRNQNRKHDIRLEPYQSKGVYTESGAIRPMPKRYPLGIVKVFLIAFPFLYLGSLASKYAALGLEKMDVFIYSDVDDDDDD
ncbi:hypothetical protein I4U23_023708 [Adineta vaga]|nr:hypothetical protein I4U23_023708 [Adineta vaga]